MSRIDTHPYDFDHTAFDMHNTDIAADYTLREFSSRDYILRDASRDYPPRDAVRDYPQRDLARDYSSQSLYQSSSPTAPYPPTDRRMGGTGSFGSYSSFVAPRMVNSMQSIGTDSWNPMLHSATQNIQRQAGTVTSSSQVQPPFINQHHRPSLSTNGASVAHLYSASPPSPFNDRDSRDVRDAYRHLVQSNPLSVQLPQAIPQSNISSAQRATLWWGELEPWMDEEYAKQVCNIMGWDPVNIKVPRPAPDPVTGQQANNPGYCFLTFPTQTHASSVLAQINNSNNGTGPAVIMPNSSKPFTLNWASSVPSAPLAPAYPGQIVPVSGAQNPQYPKEYSIFVGDLAPEVSNSDLVAVFRNPVLGLRNDREPRFIRPFSSCKSAKIMLDPVTGVSRGYGFVRFTDEADQQRALIEMHGLYCLSRPMRISPATAKYKPPPGMTALEYATQAQFQPVNIAPPVPEPQAQVTIALPLPSTNQAKSVSAPLAVTGASSTSSHTTITPTSVSNSVSVASLSAPSLASGSSVGSSSSTLASAGAEDSNKLAQYGANGNVMPNGSGSVGAGTPLYVPLTQEQLMAQKYNIPEESWKHHAQARAILSNLIGPNGEQLTSSDPYNTTVFVGGLSPLISEETLRTFFAPFGDIHYVKVPVGKHCGFVQFVRKPDAEKAIEKMQGFPIGGSRIRLSWGRSQYKAAQAAAQAAQAAAVQAQYEPPPPAEVPATLTHEQAMQLLEKFGLTPFLNGGGPPSASDSDNSIPSGIQGPDRETDGERLRTSFDTFVPKSAITRTNGGSFSASSFSPFSPDPNYMTEEARSRDAAVTSQSQPLSHLSKVYTPWYVSTQDEKVPAGSGKVSPTSQIVPRPPSASQRFGPFFGDGSSTSSYQTTRTSSRQEAPIARPDSLSRRGSQAVPYSGQGQEHDDSIQDLNGTLASLDLDHHQSHQSSWKSSGEGTHVHSHSISP